MSKNNNITGDRIVNNKGSQDKYRKGWEEVFGKKEDKDSASEELAKSMKEAHEHLYSYSNYMDIGVSDEELWDLYEE